MNHMNLLDRTLLEANYRETVMKLSSRLGECSSRVEKLQALCLRAAAALQTVSMTSEQVQELIAQLRKAAE